MAPALTAVDKAFEDAPNIKKRVYDAIGTFALARPSPQMLTVRPPTIAKTPEYETLFTDIASYTLSLKAQAAIRTEGEGERPAKRQRGGEQPVTTSSNGVSGSKALDAAPATLAIKELSFSVPQRKKLTLELAGEGLTEVLRARNTVTGFLEFGVPMREIGESTSYSFSSRVLYYAVLRDATALETSEAASLLTAATLSTRSVPPYPRQSSTSVQLLHHPAWCRWCLALSY